MIIGFFNENVTYGILAGVIAFVVIYPLFAWVDSYSVKKGFRSVGKKGVAGLSSIVSILIAFLTLALMSL